MQKRKKLVKQSKSKLFPSNPFNEKIPYIDDLPKYKKLIFLQAMRRHRLQIN